MSATVVAPEETALKIKIPRSRECARTRRAHPDERVVTVASDHSLGILG